MKLTYYSEVKNGSISNSASIRNAIHSFEGKRIEISIQIAKKKRSVEQNRYYYGVVVPIVTAALIDSGVRVTDGNTHDFLKLEFLKYDVPTENGEYITMVKSTTELSTSEFMDYTAEIQQWAAEFLGIEIPNPNEQMKLDIIDIAENEWTHD
ncbi:hypothetical protein N8508_00380 [bacterium]|nr:hypothetical protein [bacterium]